MSKNLFLSKITLKNFKGIRDLTVTFGHKTNIFGDNAVGKTTLFDAFTWLLFDKDSQNKKDFEIKTLDSNNSVIHGLEHEVEAVFDIDTKQLTLKKTYEEKWTKKRGSATAEFTGHTTSYYIDGVPSQKKEYEFRIAQIGNEDLFKLLTNPAYFNEQLHWEKRRKVLLEVAGDISDEEVIASDNALSKLPEILNGRALEDHRKVIAARRSEINKELDKLPVRIDETNRSLPDITGIDTFTISSQIAGLKSKLLDKHQELSRIRNGGEVAEKTKQLREIEGKLLGICNKHNAENHEKIQAKRTEQNRLNSNISELEIELKNQKYAIQSNELSIERLERYAAQLRDDWHICNNRQFAFKQDSNCPSCGQALPEEELDKAREKALAIFNRQKSEDLEVISSKGKQSKSEIEQLKSDNTSMQYEINSILPELEKLQQHASAIQSEIDNMVQSAPSITDNQEYLKAVKEKESLEVQIASLSADSTNLVNNIKEEIRLIENEIQDLEKSLAQVDQYKRGQERINDLKLQEKLLSSEFEKLEGELYLTEQFIRAKVTLLEDKINSCFKYANFKLFEEQINGGLQETCQTTFKGVPYTSLNNAARINVGLDIINTLSDHYSFSAPIFVDNAEAVTKLIETKSQMIKLTVPPSYDSLPNDIKRGMEEMYGDYERAKDAWEKQNKTLRVEIAN